MLETLLAIAPIFAIILLGAGMKRSGFAPDSFWDIADRVVFLVFFPCLLVRVLATADLQGLSLGPMVLALMATLLAMPLVLALARPVLGIGGPAFTSVIQSSIRPNTYVYLSAVVALFGEAGLAPASVCIAIGVPLVNVISVAALLRYGHGGYRGRWAIPRQIATNPIVIACAFGASLNLSGIGLPPVAGPVIGILAAAALPLGLLSVGAGLDLEAARRGGRALILAIVAKLVALPLLAIVLMDAFGAEDAVAAVAVLLAATPVSASAYVMARRMGGDAPLLAAMLTAQTALSALTLPIIVSLIR